MDLYLCYNLRPLVTHTHRPYVRTFADILQNILMEITNFCFFLCTEGGTPQAASLDARHSIHSFYLFLTRYTSKCSYTRESTFLLLSSNAPGVSSKIKKNRFFKKIRIFSAYFKKCLLCMQNFIAKSH
jgi:hypothetical protein